MIVRLSTKEVQNMVNVLKAIVPTKHTHAILENIHITMEDGTLVMSASDLEKTVSMSLAYSSEDQSEYTFLVEFKTFYQIVSKIKDEQIELEFDDDYKLGTIKIKKGTFDFPIQSAELFVSFDKTEFKDIEPIKVSVDKFLKSIKRSQSFQFQDDSKPQLCGTYFTVKGNTMTVYATDQNRMYREFVETNNEIQNEVGCLLSKNGTQLVQLLNGLDEVSIYISQNKILFENEFISFSLMQLEMKYPNCEAIFPKKCATYAVMDTDETIDAFVQTKVCCGSDNENVAVEHKKGIITLSAENIANGRNAEMRIDKDFIFENTLEEGLRLGLRAMFISQSLSVLKTKKVKMYIEAPYRPLIFVGADDDNADLDNITILVMPILL